MVESERMADTKELKALEEQAANKPVPIEKQGDRVILYRMTSNGKKPIEGNEHRTAAEWEAYFEEIRGQHAIGIYIYSRSELMQMERIIKGIETGDPQLTHLYDVEKTTEED
jgi:hypothetical protein